MGSSTLAPIEAWIASAITHTEMNMNQVFQVEGMSCGHCVHAVTGAIQEIDAAARVQVDLATGTVEVVSERPRRELAEAIREAGYDIAA